MFGGKFGLARFNLAPGEDRSFYVKARFYETVRHTSAVGTNVDIVLRGNADVGGTAVVTCGVPCIVTVIEDLRADMSMLGTYPIAVSAVELLAASARLSENIGIKIGASDDVCGDIWLSETINLAVSGRESVLSDTYLSKTILYAVFTAEMLFSAMSVSTLDREEMRIEVTIPPNGRLYIDSDNFNILLDGKNILHLHSGDWIHLDRDTLRIELDSGSGGTLSGNLLVTERFL